MRRLGAPLVHFLAGGAVLFWLTHASNPPMEPVVVTTADVSRLRVDYARETGLEATAADEAALVDRVVEEELLFREAVARGLDQHDRSVRNWMVEQMRVLSDDTTADADELYARARELGLEQTDLVVRRILVQKMRLLAARLDERHPRDAELETFYGARRDEYRPPDRVTFRHVFLASSGHGAADAEALLARLRRGTHTPDEAVREGDTFAVPPRLVAQSAAQIERLFGAQFARTVERAETRTWIGPVASPYGVHLVWIEAREAGTPPPLTAVRDRVRERWQDERRKERVIALRRELERRYPLRVESAAWRERRAS
jgi:hypothetical protein